MSLQDMISTPDDRPVICTITGDSGVGKTRLANTFPKPLVIRAEDGLQSIPKQIRPQAFDLLSSEAQLWEQLSMVIKEDHDFKTLIIDSVTALERLFIQSVIESDPKKPKGINQALGGYGNGPMAVASLHQRVRKACGILNEKKGMHIVFIAHADTEQIELPDQDPYTRYSLRLGKKSIAPYVDDSDIVGFLKLQTFVTGGDESKKAKAISDGTRELVTYATAANVSKNRYGITKPLEVELDVNPLTPFITSLQS